MWLRGLGKYIDSYWGLKYTVQFRRPKHGNELRERARISKKLKHGGETFVASRVQLTATISVRNKSSSKDA